ncbi:MAG TPA: twin-arginine translocation signal domain-containing protein [Candidatus Krumholzibacteria bacterium]|nr:twin-arginine translocation signal domain-containing protein [Candidatus Krumholzibacteria bacterium]
MTATRRDFLKTAALTGAALGLGGVPLPGFGPLGARAADPLKVLILGGTGQTGPHLVRDLLDRGHAVTLFNRGNRSEQLFPDVECLVGDRALDAADGLKALQEAVAAGRRWDVCIDIWPQIPKMVETTATLLKGSVDHYMFVSSISVYADFSQPGGDEDTPVGEAPNADELEYTDALFGPFKAECENRVRRIYPHSHTIIRPGLIVGPRDMSNRGVYWPVRARRGGEVLAPGTGDDPVQIIDGRDLTAFETLCMEKRTFGTFNVTGPHPDHPLTMRGLVEGCRAATGSDATFTWADTAFLEEQGIGAWMDMPCWIPAEGEYAGFGSRGIGRAVSAGLTFRPLTDTVRDTLTWYDGLDDERRAKVTARCGLSPEREAVALEAWHKAKG